MHIAIVEDDANVRQQLSSFIGKFYEEDSSRYQLSVFSDGDEILEDYRANYDLILLDIQMKHLNGLAAAEKIRALDKNVYLVFVTNLANYAIKGYSVQAFDFILKPVNYMMLKQLLQRVDKLVSAARQRFITLPTDLGLTRIDVSRIYYVETDAHFLIIKTDQGEYRMREAMKNLEAEIGKYGFFRCNNCYLVNLQYVERADGNRIIVHGEELTISRPRYKEFMETLTRYWGELHI